MLSKEIAAHATTVLRSLAADGIGLDDALSVLVSALASMAANNGIEKDEVMHNVSGAYDLMITSRASGSRPS